MSEPSEPISDPILDALRGVEDPAIRKPIVDLGMVADVGRNKRQARIVVKLPADDYPATAELERRVVDAVVGIDGIKKAAVEFAPMTDDEVAGLQAILRPTSSVPDQGGMRENVFQTGDVSARVIAVTSGKGGVGKSTISTNLAVALARLGHRVGALDADIYGFSIPRMIGIDHPPTVVGEMLIPPEAHGVGTISMGFFADEDQPIMWRGPMIHKAMEQFLVDVYWGAVDFVVVDMPPGTGEIAISMSQFLPDLELVVVTTPQPAAQRVAQRAGKMAERVNQRILGVVENMSWLEMPDGSRREIFGAGGGERLASDLDVPLLGQVPLDEDMRIGSDEGRPIVATNPENPAAVAIRSIAERIAAEPRKKIRSPELKVKTV